MSRLEKAYSIGIGQQDVLPPPVQASAAPASTDIKFPLGQVWLDTTAGLSYILAKKAAGAATWNLMAPGASDVDTLSGDSGGNRPPTTGNIVLAGGTNITTAGAASTITINMDAAITLATSVTSPIYTSAAAMAINVAAGSDITMKMGDAVGTNKISFADSASAEVASLDSDGTLTVINMDGIIGATTPAAITGTTITLTTSVTSPIYTSAAAMAINVAAGSDITMKMGDAVGTNKISFADSASAEVASLDSDGTLTVINMDGIIGATTPAAITGTTITGNTSVTSGGNIIMSAVATQLQMNGGAVTDFIGQGTLVAGTVTIANTNIAAGDRIFVTRSALNASPALGHLITTISASTSFTVASFNASGAAATTDVSSFDYFIVRQS